MKLNSLGRVCCLLLILFLGSGMLLAQTATTTVLGQITDQQNAAIIGAKVTVTNLSTGLVREVHTDSSGGYQITSLPPGTYSMKVEMTGFRTVTHDKVELLVNTSTRLNTTLQVGAATETVEVSAAAERLNTTDASVGNAFNENQIRQLPLEGRNVVGLLSLQPGAVFVPTTYTDNRQGSISGSHGDQTNVTMDGVDVNDPVWGYAYTSVLRATLDSTQEFRVTTTNYGADQGRSSAAQVSLVTKSGSNAFHGSAYWYHRNTAWSSNEFFNKSSQLWNAANGMPLDNQNKPPVLQKHIWGWSFGGPVWKDRFFFFLNMENLRQKSQEALARSVASRTFRDGILQYACADPDGTGPLTPADACPAANVTGLSGQSYAIPAGRHGLSPGELAGLDPLGIGPSLAASAYFMRYPEPNAIGRDGYNFAEYRFPAMTLNNQYTYISRFDFKIDPAGNHTLTWRGNLQDDARDGAPVFPGMPPDYKTLGNSRGMMASYTAVLGSHLVNTFRYGYTRIGGSQAGSLRGPQAIFRFLTYTDGYSANTFRHVPTHNFVDDVSLNRGKHTFQFGANIRLTRVATSDDNDAWPYVVANGSWVASNGRRFRPGTNCPSNPSWPNQNTTANCLALPAVAGSGISSFADGWVDILGVMSQASTVYHYNKDGSLIPDGVPVRRNFATNAWEYYVQDNWRIKSNLNIVYGLRYSLNSPPWEVNGLQVAPDVNMNTWFEKRRQNMLAGIPDNTMPLVNFNLAGAANGKPGYYPYDKNNVAPRVAMSYSPNFNDGLLKRLTGGPGKMVIRAGYGLVYDNMGLGMANYIDRYSSFGMASDMSSGWRQYNEDVPEIRYVNTTTVPPTLPTAPPGGFPATPPTFAGAISTGLDNSLTTPYAHMFNFMIGRELPGNMTLDLGYVGRRGRELVVRRDLAMPLNLVDPVSKMDYFTASRQLIDALAAAGQDWTQLAPIPYFENLFPTVGASYNTYYGEDYGMVTNNTQGVGFNFADMGGDWTTALYNLDEYCDPDCSRFGQFAYFNQQWDALGVISTMGRSEYHALQASLRKRYSRGLDFTLNYTMSKSSDLASAVERGSFWTSFDNGGYTGFMINSWDPKQSWGISDFDVRHQINFNWTWDLPFGQKKMLGGGVPGWLNAIIGDWQSTGIYRWTSGFPLSIEACRSCWPTNWQLQGNAVPIDPNKLPATGRYLGVVGDPTLGPLLPSMFKDPATAYTNYFRLPYPGEGSVRNYLRGQGYFTIDMGLGKAWSLPYREGHKLKFRWEVFNLTNTSRFDVGDVWMIPDNLSTFGSYQGVLNGCDNAAGRCMQASLRYEF